MPVPMAFTGRLTIGLNPIEGFEACLMPTGDRVLGKGNSGVTIYSVVMSYESRLLYYIHKVYDLGVIWILSVKVSCKITVHIGRATLLL